MNIRRIASIADISVGIWLLVSTLLFRGAPEHAVIAGIVGLAAVGFGVASLPGRDWCRWIVAGFGVWLLYATWTFERSSAAIVVNNLLAGTLLFGFSALPTGRGRATGAYPL